MIPEKNVLLVIDPLSILVKLIPRHQTEKKNLVLCVLENIIKPPCSV